MTSSSQKENDVKVCQVVGLRAMSTGDGGKHYDPRNVKDAILSTVRYGSDFAVRSLWERLPRFADDVWETAFAGCCARRDSERLRLLLSFHDPPMDRALDQLKIAEATGAADVKAALDEWVSRNL